MQFQVLSVLALAAFASAYPGGAPHGSSHDLTITDASNKCGGNQLSCCNKQTTNVANGIAAGLAQGLGGIFDGCSSLSVGARMSLFRICAFRKALLISYFKQSSAPATWSSPTASRMSSAARPARPTRYVYAELTLLNRTGH